jgi:futalosine hydrolase
MAKERSGNFNVDVESMEGAACFSICHAFGIPCYEIRAVSNFATTRDKSTWRIPEALAALRAAFTSF